MADAVGCPRPWGGPTVDVDAGPAPPGGWDDPALIGLVHERTATPPDRKARGAWYTPPDVVAGLVELATADGWVPERVIDPTCGGGAFLLAALDRLVTLGVSPGEAVDRVVGVDVDRGAAEAARWSVSLWAAARGVGPRTGAGEPAEPDGVVVGDSLTAWPQQWSGPATLVVGNPPFASPLRSGALPPAALEVRRARDDLLGPYADLAAIHLVVAVERVGPGSRVVLVVPQSLLAGRDTGNLRRWLDEVAPLRALWASREAVFDAGVRVWAPVLEVGSAPVGPITLARGRAVEPSGTATGRGWAALAADAVGSPRPPRYSGRLGELVTATAGFRDEHYGLVAACRELDPDAEAPGPGWGRLVTVGSVDPLSVGWGREPTRFGGRRWTRPVIDPSALSPKVGAWLERQLRPKVVLATQSRLLEPAVDRVGDVAPATPLIAVHAEPAELDRVAAVLLAPPVLLWAWRRSFGAAMSVEAVKLAARQVGDVPLPVDDDRWAEAAGLVAGADGGPGPGAWASTVEVARLMNAAYGGSVEVFQWWLARVRPPART